MFVENLLIKKIHSSPFQFNFVFTGGGSLALSHLISTPGASKTVVEAFIPYSEESMDDYLGKKQEAYCNKKVTLDLAMKARWKLLYLKKNRPPSYQVGIGLTASLSSLQEKKGDIRFHLVACGSSFTKILTVVFEKKHTTRNSEEVFISLCLQFLLAKICGFEVNMPIQDGAKIELNDTVAKEEWKLILEGRKDFFQQGQHADPPKVIFPGSFNSLHSGHIEMKKIAEARLGKTLFFEISLANADKTSLSFYELERVIEQFEKKHPYLITNVPTFVEKAKLFPDATFVIGFDTLVRMFEPRFYKNEQDMFSKLAIFHEKNINFLVFGRKLGDSFRCLEDFDLPQNFGHRFTGLSEKEFREDISSTELRRKCFF